jgi:hypothetical protein
MRIACFILKATDTLRICDTYCFAMQQWSHDTPHCYGIRTSACLVTYILRTMLTNAARISFHFDSYTTHHIQKKTNREVK